jgi:hypothetical protein
VSVRIPTPCTIYPQVSLAVTSHGHKNLDLCKQLDYVIHNLPRYKESERERSLLPPPSKHPMAMTPQSDTEMNELNLSADGSSSLSLDGAIVSSIYPLPLIYTKVNVVGDLRDVHG